MIIIIEQYHTEIQRYMFNLLLSVRLRHRLVVLYRVLLHVTGGIRYAIIHMLYGPSQSAMVLAPC